MPYNYAGLPPEQINTDPYFTKNTGDIMRDVMGYAQNTQNQRQQGREYWYGQLPLAYGEAVRDQWNKVMSGLGQSYQNRTDAIKQQVQNISDMLRERWGDLSPEERTQHMRNLQDLNQEFLGMKPQVQAYNQKVQGSAFTPGMPLTGDPNQSTSPDLQSLMQKYMQQNTNPYGQ